MNIVRVFGHYGRNTLSRCEDRTSEIRALCTPAGELL
jgi:hypothetical protein